MVAMDNSCFWLAEIKKKIVYSETRRHNELLLYRNYAWNVMYKISVFRVNRTTNMAAIDSSCLSIKKYSLKSYWPNKFKFDRKHIWKFPHLVQIRKQAWPPWEILVSDWLKFFECSPMKVQGIMNCYFVWLMYGSFLTNHSHFVPIDN